MTNDADQPITCDAIVLGMGPGGEVVASKLAAAGLEVIGIDARLVGGECAYWGCVPSKMMLHAAHLLHAGRRIDEYAGHADIAPDWAPVAARIRDTTDDWDDTAAVERFEANGGRFVRGRGTIVGSRRVVVDGVTYEARRALVLATGTSPATPPIDGLADTPYWTNREAIEATEVPDRLAVIGGGAIGCELSQVFARFGSSVTVIEAADRIHGGAEPEATEVLHRALERDGIDIRTGVQAVRVAHRDGQFTIELDDGSSLTADRLLVVTGRDAHLDELGVTALGFPRDAKFVDVDDHLRVTTDDGIVDGVWAIGDVTGIALFTHVATYHARLVVDAVLGDAHAPVDHRAVPAITFTEPELARVGMTEREARDAGLDVATSINDGSARAWLTGQSDDVLVKLIADRDRDVLVGATVVGPAGGDVLGLLVLAVHAEVPLDRLRTTIYAYPAHHRAIEDAIHDLPNG